MHDIGKIIARHGWAATGVLESEDAPSFTYSTGFQSTLAQPDVVMIGFSPRLCHMVLNSLQEGLRGGRLSVPQEGGKVDQVIKDFPVLFRPVTEEQAERFAYITTSWNAALGERTSMMHLILPDPQGRFPGEPGVHPDYEAIQDISLILSDAPSENISPRLT